MGRTIIAVSVAGLVVSFAATAAAQQASAKPLTVQAGLGASIGVSNRSGAGFQLVESVAYHVGVGGETPEDGLHVGAEIGEAFGDGFVTLSFAGQIGYDLRVDLHSTNLGLLIDPYVNLGLGVVFPSGVDAQAAFLLGFGGDVKLTIGDTWFVMLRPLAFDVFIQENTSVAYELLLGGGARF